jgi:hypothetical protein
MRQPRPVAPTRQHEIGHAGDRMKLPGNCASVDSRLSTREDMGMLTRALAVVGVVALTATMSPGAASIGAGAAEASANADTVRVGAAQRAGYVVRDLQRRDPRHVRPAFDADSLRVFPRYRRGWLIIQVEGDTLNRGRRFNALELHLQTRGDRRPDYRIVHRLSRDGDGLSGGYVKRIRRWEGAGHQVSCPRLSAKWRINSQTRWVELYVPRPCIHRQGRVRVNAETWNYTRYRADGTPLRGRADAVPARNTLSRWI